MDMLSKLNLHTFCAECTRMTWSRIAVAFVGRNEDVLGRYLFLMKSVSQIRRQFSLFTYYITTDMFLSLLIFVVRTSALYDSAFRDHDKADVHSKI